MIDVTQDIQPLTEFKKNAGRMIGQAKRSGRPLVLTVKGKAEAVVLGAADYQRLLERTLNPDYSDFLDRSLADLDAGRVVPMREAIANLGRKKS